MIKKNNSWFENNKNKCIAKNISLLLESNNINANQLASKLEIPSMTIRRLLLGETEDPRISTLKLIADFFNVSVDSLLDVSEIQQLQSTRSVKTYIIPKLDWDSIKNVNLSDIFAKKNWKEWQTFTFNSNSVIGKNAFAIESRPSMFHRFPKGTIFIIDPDTSPNDADIILLRFIKNDEYSLRELVIDQPNWKLTPLILNSNVLEFNEQEHAIIGVNLLTLLYNPNIC